MFDYPMSRGGQGHRRYFFYCAESGGYQRYESAPQQLHRGAAQEGRPSINRFAVTAGIVALGIIIPVLSYHLGKMRGGTVAPASVEETVEGSLSHGEQAEGIIKALHGEMLKQKMLRLRAEKLPIEGLMISNVNAELVITGKIINRGGDVSDVELTAYLLDGRGEPVAEHKYAARSSDGLPLKKGQARRFRFKVPAEGDEVVVLVTGVEKEG